jgi:hypothetical protein
MAGGISIYVVDVWPIGASSSHCCSVGHQAASILGYLGVQVTSRNTQQPSQAQGAWLGIIATTGQEGVGIHCSQEKWEKVQCYIQELQAA